MSDLSPARLSHLVDTIALHIEQARTQVRQVVNSIMVQSYWEIGRVIVEDEQQGQQRAEYGKQQLQILSQQLTERLGKGFDVTNLRNMRAFYTAFPKRDAVRLELSWTHYRALLRVDNPAAREWYLSEAINQSWSARALERQISKLYYERLLASQDRAAVELEAKELVQPLAENAKDYLRDPYILDFLNLEDKRYQDIGQMDTYVRLYDEQRKGNDDNPTIGLVLCSEKSEAVVKYSVLADQKQLFAAKYLPYLPTEEELKRELEREREQALAQLQQRERGDE